LGVKPWERFLQKSTLTFLGEFPRTPQRIWVGPQLHFRHVLGVLPEFIKGP